MPIEVRGPPEIGVTGSCESPHVVVGSQARALWESSMHYRAISSPKIKSFEIHLFNNYVLDCQASGLGDTMKAEMEKKHYYQFYTLLQS